MMEFHKPTVFSAKKSACPAHSHYEAIQHTMYCITQDYSIYFWCSTSNTNDKLPDTPLPTISIPTNYDDLIPLIRPTHYPHIAHGYMDSDWAPDPTTC